MGFFFGVFLGILLIVGMQVYAVQWWRRLRCQPPVPMTVMPPSQPTHSPLVLASRTAGRTACVALSDFPVRLIELYSPWQQSTGNVCLVQQGGGKVPEGSHRFRCHRGMPRRARRCGMNRFADTSPVQLKIFDMLKAQFKERISIGVISFEIDIKHVSLGEQLPEIRWVETTKMNHSDDMVEAHFEIIYQRADSAPMLVRQCRPCRCTGVRVIPHVRPSRAVPGTADYGGGEPCLYGQR